jgi:hypothetical protein
MFGLLHTRFNLFTHATIEKIVVGSNETTARQISVLQKAENFGEIDHPASVARFFFIQCTKMRTNEQKYT